MTNLRLLGREFKNLIKEKNLNKSNSNIHKRVSGNS